MGKERGIAITIIMLSVIGCASASRSETAGGKSPSPVLRDEPKMITISAKGGALKLDPTEYTVREFDRNGDKKPDIVNVYKKNAGAENDGEQRLFIKIMDLNLDGKYDVYRFYDENGAVAKEELDLDFDGKIETTDIYRGGVVIQKEIDSQFDEKTDIWKFYDEKGVIVRLEEDQDGDGKVDYWEIYTNGALERIEKDTDRDGRPDVFKRAGDQKFTTIIRNDGQFGSDLGPQTPGASQQPQVPGAQPSASESPKNTK